jgi:acetoin utilization deacetylase AcuC-like enzyme
MNAEQTLHIAYHRLYAHPLPESHRFPMQKYELIPQQLLYEGTIQAENIFEPALCSDEDILRTHTTDYLQKLKNGTLTEKEQRRIGFPQSPQLIKRELIITQGTIDCCHYAMKNGVAMNVAGGTHHAFADRGEGFCLLNDFAIAAHYLLHHKMAEQMLVIDLDVHQGNGTAKIFENEPRVFTCSVHGRNNYPFHKEVSDVDIAVEDGITDGDYLQLLHDSLPRLINQVKPQFAFYLSGVDILESDKFGKLKVTMQGCRQRDEFVFSLLHQHKIPTVVTMGGGYSRR